MTSSTQGGAVSGAVSIATRAGLVRMSTLHLHGRSDRKDNNFHLQAGSSVSVLTTAHRFFDSVPGTTSVTKTIRELGKDMTGATLKPVAFSSDA